MMNNTLTSVFSLSEGSLRDMLKEKFLPKDYKEIQNAINSHIITLLADDNAFKSSLNTSDAELLNAALRMALSFQQLSLADSIDFKALSTKTEFQIENRENDKEGYDVVENTISLLPTVICAFINPWLSLAVGGGTVLVKKIVRYKNGVKKEVLVKEKKTDISHQITDKEINAIIDNIRNICYEIDEIISKIQRDRNDIIAKMQDKLDNCSLDKMYPQILSSIQYLAKENIESEIKDQNIDDIIFSLKSYGYEIVEYSTTTSGFFAQKVNPNVKQETMYIPAIIRDINGSKIVVAQGIVYIPISVH